MPTIMAMRVRVNICTWCGKPVKRIAHDECINEEQDA